MLLTRRPSGLEGWLKPGGRPVSTEKHCACLEVSTNGESEERRSITEETHGEREKRGRIWEDSQSYSDYTPTGREIMRLFVVSAGLLVSPMTCFRSLCLCQCHA